jgi:ribosomal protein L12E/L44/L45/RPP1/RPP2
MVMRLPDSGSVLGSIVSGLGRAVADGQGIAVDGVTEAQLDAALAALSGGDLEYVILEDGEAFVQAAGEGAGPYALQYSPASGDGMEEVRGGVADAAMRDALRAYRRGDPTWRTRFQWSAL